MNPFIPGRVYHRKKEIHEPYGGQEQGGISTPQNCNMIFLFTGESGKNYGYDQHDRWHGEQFFLTGEGQNGNQQFIRGNKAIQNHVELGKDLHLFTYDGMTSGHVRYLGQMICANYHTDKAPDAADRIRDVIVFELTPFETFQLTPVDEAELHTLSVEELEKKAAAQSSEEPKVAQRITLYRQRSKYIKLYALKRANGHCEGCNQPAPFITQGGSHYLEVHHLERLSDGGPDRPDAVIAICPNCHRRAHYANDFKEYNEKLTKIAHSKVLSSR